MRQKRIPLRMCAGCLEMKSKRELIRIVRTPQEEVLLDSSGKKSGRGVYICPDKECLKKALKSNRLEKSLQHPISLEVIERLKIGLGYENNT